MGKTLNQFLNETKSAITLQGQKGGTKFKVVKLSNDLKHGMKVGEIIDDSELDDLLQMDVKVTYQK